MGLKIVTIGGGSSYTPELVEGFIKRYDELPVEELWFVDIPEGEEKMKIVTDLAKRMVKKAGVPMKIYTTLDRREALKDADFVTTQMRVGRLPARVLDERIPLENGLIGQETNGAGGLFKALRTIPVILDIAEDMQELCPNAWLVNFTNPAGIVTEAVYRYSEHKKVVGLCNVPVGMHMGLAKAFDVEKDRVRMEIAGLNHHFFVTDVFVDGVSKKEEMINHYMKEADEKVVENIDATPWSSSLIKGLNSIPCPYLNYYYNTQDQLDKQLEDFKEHKVRGEVVAELEKDLFELYKDPELDIKPPQLEKRGGAHYSDAACDLINSIYNDKCDVQYVDTPNKGALSNMKHDSIVEVASIITAEGPKPLAVGNIPEPLNGTIQNIKSFEEMAIEAAITGDRDLAIAAMNLNPLVTSDKLAAKVFDELYEAHKQYLPQFVATIEK